MSNDCPHAIKLRHGVILQCQDDHENPFDWVSATDPDWFLHKHFYADPPEDQHGDDGRLRGEDLSVEWDDRTCQHDVVLP